MAFHLMCFHIIFSSVWSSFWQELLTRLAIFSLCILTIIYEWTKFYDSAKLPIHSTYNVDDNFRQHFNQNIKTTKRKESKVTVNIISKEIIAVIVLETNESNCYKK